VLSDHRRQEIATFLKIRRTRRQPEDVGLPRLGRRRTPGLRRGEVAALAGVSLEWYTWLEQARDVRPSADTLRRIAGALRLEPGESVHLLTLAGHAAPAAHADSHRPQVSAPVQALIDQLDYCPAWIYGERWDILAWNRAATVIWGDIGAMQGIERNSIYQLFLSPRIRETLHDWTTHARDCVARLRATHGRNVDDPWFNELVQLLVERSPEFATWWSDYQVKAGHSGRKMYVYPDVGEVQFDFTVLEVSGERAASQRLTTYVPVPDTDTRAKMEALLDGAAAGVGSAR
jgi:transcriptional regulator with XRE-family HTH domain